MVSGDGVEAVSRWRPGRSIVPTHPRGGECQIFFDFCRVRYSSPMAPLAILQLIQALVEVIELVQVLHRPGLPGFEVLELLVWKMFESKTKVGKRRIKKPYPAAD